MKIVTWNVNSIRQRYNLLIELINEHRPDVILLQELKCETEKFPMHALGDLPYNFYVHGEKGYNGVAIMSKFPLEDIKFTFASDPCSTQARFIEGSAMTDFGYCSFISLYVINGSEVGSDKYQLKLAQYEALKNYLAMRKEQGDKIVLGSDFNVAPFDLDVYSVQAMQDNIAFTLPEKQVLRQILNMPYLDLFRLVKPEVKEFSWWDYRGKSLSLNKGLRLDSIIASPCIAQHTKDAYIDHNIRARDKASDHAPVIVEIS